MSDLTVVLTEEEMRDLLTFLENTTLRGAEVPRWIRLIQSLNKAKKEIEENA